MKLLINGHDLKFLNHFLQHYRSKNDFEVAIDEHSGHVIIDKAKSEKLLGNADVIFCEWCLGNAEWYSQNKKNGQTLLIRLHHQEINLPFLEKISWQNVDKLIFICGNNRRLFLEKFPHLKEKTTIIFNLIDCEHLNQPKLRSSEFNLGFIGSAPMRKAPHLAITILERLKQIDRRYCLFIKGKQPWEYDWLWRRPAEREYYEHFYAAIEESPFKNSIVFDPHGNDISEWFSKIGFVLSTSEHEGSHQAVAEGMASGAIPIIRNWDGADLIYPAKYIFKNVNDAVELILQYHNSENYTRETEFSKSFARENFDKGVVLKTYDDLIASLC